MITSRPIAGFIYEPPLHDMISQNTTQNNTAQYNHHDTVQHEMRHYEIKNKEEAEQNKSIEYIILSLVSISLSIFIFYFLFHDDFNPSFQ